MRRSGSAGTIAALILTCVFGATLLLSLAAGAVVYRRVAARVESSAEARVGLTYITTKVHSYDTVGAVEAGTFSGQDALYLYEEINGLTYETILYVHDGWLKELYCEKGWEPELVDGTAITEAEDFSVEQPSSGLLWLKFTGADGVAETAGIYLRSGG